MAPQSRMMISMMSRSHLFWYRLLGGAGMTGKIGAAPFLLLTTTGRKSGKERTTPLIFLRDGENLVVVASNNGDDNDPGWWRNLRARPDATVQIKRQTLQVRAERASPEEKARLWPSLVAIYKNYDVYTKRTTRDIPVVILRPAPL